MRQEIMSHYGITREFSKAGFYETERHRQILRELKSAVQQGKFVTMSGIVGCGKTTTLHRLQEQLETEGDILVAKSLSVDKECVSLAALLMALFYDLSTEKDLKIPSRPEKRERALRELIKKRKKLVALYQVRKIRALLFHGLCRLGKIDWASESHQELTRCLSRTITASKNFND